MNKGYTYEKKIIKNSDVSEEEYAYILEHANELKGFNVEEDWERVYPYGDTFKKYFRNSFYFYSRYTKKKCVSTT